MRKTPKSSAKRREGSYVGFPPAEMILYYLTEPHHCGLMSWSKSNCGSQSVVQSQRMALSPAEKPESKAAAMPAPSAVGATAAPAKSKTDPPAGGFGSKSIVLFSISLFELGFSGSYLRESRVDRCDFRLRPPKCRHCRR